MKSLLSEIAALQSKLDYFETEFCQINKLLKKCGFENGLETLKESANELINESKFSIKKGLKIKKRK